MITVIGLVTDATLDGMSGALAIAMIPLWGEASFGAEAPPELRRFLQSNCSDCHSGSEADAGLNLETIGTDLSDAATEARWVRIHDRVQSGARRLGFAVVDTIWVAAPVGGAVEDADPAEISRP